MWSVHTVEVVGRSNERKNSRQKQGTTQWHFVRSKEKKRVGFSSESVERYNTTRIRWLLRIDSSKKLSTWRSTPANQLDLRFYLSFSFNMFCIYRYTIISIYTIDVRVYKFTPSPCEGDNDPSWATPRCRLPSLDNYVGGVRLERAILTVGDEKSRWGADYRQNHSSEIDLSFFSSLGLFSLRV